MYSVTGAVSLLRPVFRFGNPRIKGCLLLPEAYRSLPRPSSTSSAKASTVCPFLLDHIIWSAINRIVCNKLQTDALDIRFFSRLKLYVKPNKFFRLNHVLKDRHFL